MTIRKVSLIGATGQLGTALLPALRQHFEVQIISRKSSQATFPDSEEVEVVRVADDYPIHELETVFAGQDAVVCALAAFSTSLQINIIEAARKAGVQRYIPAEFGLDTEDSTLAKALPALAPRAAVLAHLQQMGSDPSSPLSWTAITTGAFFDWGLRTKFIHFDIEKRHAEILGDGNTRFSATTLNDIGHAVVAVLQKEEETKNKNLYVQSFGVTLNEIFAALKKFSKGQWTVEHLEVDHFVKDNTEKAQNGEIQGLYNQIYAFGVLHSLFESRPTFATGLLDMPVRNVEEEVAKVLKEYE